MTSMFFYLIDKNNLNKYIESDILVIIFELNYFLNIFLDNAALPLIRINIGKNAQNIMFNLCFPAHLKPFQQPIYLSLCKPALNQP